jgi:hypothetical protein
MALFGLVECALAVSSADLSPTSCPTHCTCWYCCLLPAKQATPRAGSSDKHEEGWVKYVPPGSEPAPPTEVRGHTGSVHTVLVAFSSSAEHIFKDVPKSSLCRHTV